MPQVKREEILRLAKRADFHGQKELSEFLYRVGGGKSDDGLYNWDLAALVVGMKLAEKIVLTPEEISQ